MRQLPPKLLELVDAGLWVLSDESVVLEAFPDVGGLHTPCLYQPTSIELGSDDYRDRLGPLYTGSLDFDQVAVIGTLHIEMDLVVSLESPYPVFFWGPGDSDWTVRFETFDEFVSALGLEDEPRER